MTPLQRLLDRLKTNTRTASKTATSFAHSREKLGMVLQSVFEPLVLGVETNEHRRRLAVTSDDDFLRSGQPEVAREIVFDLCQGDFTARLPRASGATLRLQLS